MTGDSEKDLDQPSAKEQFDDSNADHTSHKCDIEASAGVTQGTSTPDPFVVDWDGPDDPQNPFNWTTFKKYRQLLGMAFNTFLT